MVSSRASSARQVAVGIADQFGSVPLKTGRNDLGTLTGLGAGVDRIQAGEDNLSMPAIWIAAVFLLGPPDVSPEVVFERAASALAAHDYGAAEQGFAAVLKKHPNHIGALGNLGVVYSRTQRSARAIETYRRALALNPGDLALRLNLGLVYFKQENYQPAAKQFSRIVAKQPNHRQAQELLATCQIHLGEPRLAISSLESLRKSDPKNAGVLYLLGMAYLRNQQPDKAKPLLDEMMLTALSPAQAHFLVGKAYYDSARFAESREAFLKVLELEPAFPNAQLELGKVWVSLREPEKAQAAFLTAMERNPQDSEAPYFLGSLLVNEGRVEEALVPLARAEGLKPDFWGTLYYLGKAKLQLRKPAEAVSLLRRAAELHSEEDAIYYQLAQALRASGRLVEASRAMERVSELKAKKRATTLRGPAPTSPPTFELAPDAVSSTPLWPVQEILDGVFFVIGTVLVLRPGWIVVTDGFDGWFGIGSVIVFWVLLAYVGLPRLQEVLSKIYVPDYFIGRSLTDVGVLGDPINLALDGSEADIHAAMTRAGWVRADAAHDPLLLGDRVVVGASPPLPGGSGLPAVPLRAAAGLRLPEQEVDGNASRRHHVRFWPVPDGWRLPGGFQVGWSAAATYDRAVGISLFTLQVTHRVDADIDISATTSSTRSGTPSREPPCASSRSTPTPSPPATAEAATSCAPTAPCRSWT